MACFKKTHCIMIVAIYLNVMAFILQERPRSTLTPGAQKHPNAWGPGRCHVWNKLGLELRVRLVKFPENEQQTFNTNTFILGIYVNG